MSMQDQPEKGKDLDLYRVEGPAVIRFSGGRTSAYMLRRILDAHGGTLPKGVHVVFSNTGKERPETLDFVQECSLRWDVPIHWIEWRLIRLDVAARAHDLTPRWLRWIEGDRRLWQFRSTWTEAVGVVTYDTASRNGEPFEALVRWKQYLPNPISRICTQHLKIEAMKLYARHHLGFDAWDAYIGIRYDEPRRWRIIGTDERNPRETCIAPLVDAGVTEEDVMAFWARQPFDLRLAPHEGNCDLCFLKGKARIQRIMRARPDLAAWWIGMEDQGFGKTLNGSRFRANRPGYAAMLGNVRSLPMLPGMMLDDPGDYAPDCACTE
jgi:3'-phosphoadenosine 5'-phosphosulfate sulfotransferase (PAPS reductase)/FAD synthetase